MTEKSNTDGRRANAALPFGERPGLVSDEGVKRTGRAERQSAGPDGPDAAEVGNTFKASPGDHRK
ncbi:hypothetical protein [Caulobacter segnis]